MEKFIIKTVGSYINLMAQIAPRYAGKFGFRLFGKPVKRKLKPREEKFLDMPVQYQFSHNRVGIRVYRWGHGKKKILLLHGWQSHSARWNDLVKVFPESEYSLYAFDAPGHGRSGGNFLSAPLYGEIILRIANQEGGFDSAIGHSFGAFSLLYTLSSSEEVKIRRAVIMGTPGEVSDFVSHFRNKLGLNRKAIDAISNHFYERFGKTYRDFSVSRFGEKLDIPGLIIHDKKDRFAPYMYAEILHSKWKQAELIMTDGLGHNLDSKEIYEHILHFTARTGSGKIAENQKALTAGS